MSPDKAGQPSREPGRPQKRLSPQDGPVPAFAQALRDLREASGQPKYRSLATYANVHHQRLAEAARGERLPRWEVVEGYVTGCRAYYQRTHGGALPPDGAIDLARLRNLYRDAGGRPPEQAEGDEIAEPPACPSAPETAGPRRGAAPHRPRLRHGRRLILAAAAATGVALLLTAAVMSGIPLSPGEPPAVTARTPQPVPRTARPHRVVVTPPAASCGNAADDGFRSPVTAKFSNVTTVSRLSLDGVSVSTMEGGRGGTGYYWIQAHPAGHRAGMQLRWSDAPHQWRYCTATLASGPISALPDLVMTIAVPAVIHGQRVRYQTCLWHQHPYSARCTPVSL